MILPGMISKPKTVLFCLFVILSSTAFPPLCNAAEPQAPEYTKDGRLKFSEAIPGMGLPDHRL